jgi:hypothetical protein
LTNVAPGGGATVEEIWAWEIEPGISAKQYLINMRTNIDLLLARAIPPTAAENAAATLVASQSSPIFSDVRKMNGANVVGTGTNGDAWRGVGVSP